MRFLPVNLNALLVELDDLAQTLALLQSLQSEPVAGVEELIPAARTILVYFNPALVPAARIMADIGARSVDAQVERSTHRVQIPVHYDGEDLQEVADLLGVAREDVVRMHTGSEYSVAFTGFAPGFAYLSGGNERLNVPRRKTPRTRIPAGAVGLAGSFSGVYPQASPGGWQIIGTTPVQMWDLERAAPSLLRPGFRVQFVDISTLSPEALAALEAECAGERVAQATGDAGSAGAAGLRVEAPGLQTLFQDGGRHGRAGQGVGASGAMDRGALRAANRVVGNPADTACLEVAFGGLTLEALQPAVLAVAGAAAPLEVLTAQGQRYGACTYAPLALDAGDRLTVQAPEAGSRNYVAVRGGWNVAPVLGSVSTDTLARVGPAALAAGDVLQVGRDTGLPAVALGEQPAFDLPRAGEEVCLDVVLGPRTDWFTQQAIDLLTAQAWAVTPQSNRVGIRLQGEAPLTRAENRELPSEGTARGAIQVPASGQPVLFLADHPLTGGYPVIGSVASYHLDLAGQIPVNAKVRFRVVRAFESIIHEKN
ncbi:urea amidolyase family protein [Comamonas endophytica]|uniref:5-oxoprolinase/urea amidolyase family protein n=1 Tax=Comamonas endophytica TaxID=2949090 RepID=A0ABY6GAE8_9BURK|nr:MULTISPECIES: urea amidolyase family protein [unclassified Acidovorax]MCD2512129.1 5-oxoprolinase/urea amidolyase family protein [Acidovorax sp. D4N7]UYG51903.1 5-oxoprolinase/urea amidolyase family protein [Acidovorax sp. 5MLIR]